MSAERVPAARSRHVPWGVLSVCALIALVVASVTVPIGTRGMCLDSSEPGGSFCETMPASLLGTSASWIAWPLVTLVVWALFLGGRALLRRTSAE